jgi:FkbM family methyltransferase
MEEQSTFISYSQMQEDAVLFQALGHIWCGFYIDVGAQDPVVDSVTKAFYKHGWHGINIEPIEQWFNKIVLDRASDINLNVAVGSRQGTLQLIEVADTGLSTASAEFAQRHTDQGFNVREVTVQMTTLNDICASEGVTEIQFLKIDVEGFEKEVLKGIDLTKIRPWIILIEATEPLSYVETWQDWESMLLSADYSFVKTDGLNRFYLSLEHEELKESLLKPIDTPCEKVEQ